MQGLWSAHRRPKINLNSAPTPTVAEEPDLTPAADAPNAEASTSMTAQPPEGETSSASDVRPPMSNGKRRSRVGRSGEESNKRIKLSSQAGGSVAKDHSPPATRLSDLGGVDACIEKMLELVAMPLCHPEVYLHTGVQPPRGVLLHGPPGCGKTLLAHAIAGVSSTYHRRGIVPHESYRNSACPSSVLPLLQSSPGCQANLKRHCEILSKRRSG